MNERTHELIRRLCDAPYLDAALGDLEELRARRARERGRWFARRRYWLDLAGILFWQSRLRRWRAREWSAAGMLAAAGVLTLAGVPAPAVPPSESTITATDAAGVFTLEMRRGRVVRATVDGRTLPPERVTQRGALLVLRGADGGEDLEIQVTPAGGIRWEGRERQERPIELPWARQYFAEVDSVSAADGGALWGVPLAGPMLFVDRASRFVVANTADTLGILAPDEGLWIGTLPEDVGIANTAVDWSGRRWTMVMWPVSSWGYTRRALLLHESFHRIQPQLAFSVGDPTNAHLATRDGRILTRLEWRALAEALLRDGAPRRAAVEDALAFRARRHALFPDAASEERLLELNEGLAEYTGLRLSGLPETAQAVTAARELIRREGADNLSRSFAYASGPAYGVLLDAADRPWRDRLGRGVGLDDLLRRAYRLGAVDGAEAEVRGRRYDGERIVTEETRAAELRAAERARLLAAFVEGPTLTLPVGDAFGYSFNPNGVVPLEGHGSVHLVAEVRDAWGRLTVESGGVLLRRPDRLITGVVVTVPPDADGPPMSGDGWRLDLATGWVVVPGARPGDWVVRPGPD